MFRNNTETRKKLSAIREESTVNTCSFDSESENLVKRSLSKNKIDCAKKSLTRLSKSNDKKVTDRSRKRLSNRVEDFSKGDEGNLDCSDAASGSSKLSVSEECDRPIIDGCNRSGIEGFNNIDSFDTDTARSKASDNTIKRTNARINSAQVEKPKITVGNSRKSLRIKQQSQINIHDKNIKTLDDGKKPLNDRNRTLNDGKSTLNDSKKILNNRKKTVIDRKKTLIDRKKRLNETKTFKDRISLNSRKETLNENTNIINNRSNTINERSNTNNEKLNTNNERSNPINNQKPKTLIKRSKACNKRPKTLNERSNTLSDINDRQNDLNDKQNILNDKQNVLNDKQNILSDKQIILNDKQNILNDRKTPPNEIIKTLQPTLAETRRKTASTSSKNISCKQILSESNLQNLFSKQPIVYIESILSMNKSSNPDLNLLNPNLNLLNEKETSNSEKRSKRYSTRNQFKKLEAEKKFKTESNISLANNARQTDNEEKYKWKVPKNHSQAKVVEKRTKSTVPKESNILKQTNILKERNILKESSTLKGSNIVNESSSLKGSNILNESSSLKGSNILNESSTLNISNILKESNIPKGSNILKESNISKESKIRKGTNILKGPSIPRESNVKRSKMPRETDILKKPTIFKRPYIRKRSNILKESNIPKEANIHQESNILQGSNILIDPKNKPNIPLEPKITILSNVLLPSEDKQRFIDYPDNLTKIDTFLQATQNICLDTDMSTLNDSLDFKPAKSSTLIKKRKNPDNTGAELKRFRLSGSSKEYDLDYLFDKLRNCDDENLSSDDGMKFSILKSISDQNREKMLRCQEYVDDIENNVKEGVYCSRCIVEDSFIENDAVEDNILEDIIVYDNVAEDVNKDKFIENIYKDNVLNDAYKDNVVNIRGTNARKAVTQDNLIDHNKQPCIPTELKEYQSFKDEIDERFFEDQSQCEFLEEIKRDDLRSGKRMRPEICRNTSRTEKRIGAEINHDQIRCERRIRKEKPKDHLRCEKRMRKETNTDHLDPSKQLKVERKNIIKKSKMKNNIEGTKANFKSTKNNFEFTEDVACENIKGTEKDRSIKKKVIKDIKKNDIKSIKENVIVDATKSIQNNTGSINNERESINDDFKSIEDDFKSIEDDIESIKDDTENTKDDIQSNKDDFERKKYDLKTNKDVYKTNNDFRRNDDTEPNHDFTPIIKKSDNKRTKHDNIKREEHNKLHKAAGANKHTKRNGIENFNDLMASIFKDNLDDSSYRSFQLPFEQKTKQNKTERICNRTLGVCREREFFHNEGEGIHNKSGATRDTECIRNINPSSAKIINTKRNSYTGRIHIVPISTQKPDNENIQTRDVMLNTFESMLYVCYSFSYILKKNFEIPENLDNVIKSVEQYFA